MTTHAQQSFAARTLDFAGLGDICGVRDVPVEVPVAIEYNGIGYAVMMATPVDLHDFAVGLAITEGLVCAASDVGDVDCHAVGGGWVVRAILPADSMARVLARARTRVSESGCGLCGIDSIETALRPAPRVTARIATDRAAIARALAALGDHQPLGRATGAAHAAAFCRPDGAIVATREDVGRHTALDKLVGALALARHDIAAGFVLLSARCSFELVDKAVRAGAPMLVTVSAPTSLAVERARDAGLVLVALARHDTALVLNDPDGCIA